MDPELKYGLLGYLSNNTVPGNISKMVQRLVEKVADHYIISKNQLVRIEIMKDTHSGKRNLVYKNVIDTHKMPEILKKAHDEPLGGHMGQENTYQRLSQMYYWPGMKQDVVNYIKTCKTCQKRERRRGEAPLEPIKKRITPFYQVGIDVMGPLPRTMTGKRYIVVAVDHFTKWVEVKAIEEADAQTIVPFIYESIICRHGIPQILSSDRGSEFVNELVTTLTRVYGIKHIRTTAYHPQGNGQVERINRTIKDILAKITPNKGDWSHYLPSVLFATRVTKSATTKFSPSELLYGHQIRQNFDPDISDVDHLSTEEIATIESMRIQNMRQQAGKFITKAQARQKLSHDNRVHLVEPLQIGDLVLLYRNVDEANLAGKLEKKWLGPYRIKDIKGLTYLLETRHQTILPNHYHRNRLKKYHGRPTPNLRSPTVEIPVRSRTRGT